MRRRHGSGNFLLHRKYVTLHIQVFIESVSHYIKQSHNQKLQGTNFAKHSPEWNQHSGYAIWGSSEILFLNMDFRIFPPSIKNATPKRRQENIYLHDDSINEERIHQSRPCMLFDVSHQESKANEHHDVHVLVHWVVWLIDIDVAMGCDSHEYSINDYDDDLKDDENNRKPVSVLFVLHLFLIWVHGERKSNKWLMYQEV